MIDFNNLPAPEKLYYLDKESGIAIYHADCRDILPLIPDKSIDLVLTDPPYYGYEDYEWDIVDLDRLLPQVRSFIFWKGRDFPLLFTARHIWAKANRNIGNSGEQYEELYEINGSKTGLVMRHAVIDSEMNAQLNGDIFYNHPTQKPAKLIQRIIIYSTSIGNLILDPFLGSGTTTYCAKKLGRKCIGIEIEEKYCEIAKKRLAQSVMKLEV